MKLLYLSALILLSGLNAWADDSTQAPIAMPERPGVPVAYVEGKRFAIVDYKGQDPVVLVDGARVTKHNAPVSIVPGEDFVLGFVTVNNVKAVHQSIVSRDPVHPS